MKVIEFPEEEDIIELEWLRFLTTNRAFDF